MEAFLPPTPLRKPGEVLFDAESVSGPVHDLRMKENAIAAGFLVTASVVYESRGVVGFAPAFPGVAQPGCSS